MKRNLLATLVLLMLGAACGGDSATNPLAEISGAYSLRTVNGTPVPFLLGPTQTGTLTIMSGSVALNANGTYLATTVVRETSGATSTTESDSSSGTWTRTNAALSFTDSADGTVTAAQYADGSLTIADGGFVWVYRK